MYKKIFTVCLKLIICLAILSVSKLESTKTNNSLENYKQNILEVKKDKKAIQKNLFLLKKSHKKLLTKLKKLEKAKKSKEEKNLLSDFIESAELAKEILILKTKISVFLKHKSKFKYFFNPLREINKNSLKELISIKQKLENIDTER